jgi:Lon protease-like protein
VRADVGTIARIVHIEALEGGRYRLVVVGTQRVRVRSWFPDDPYPVADVDEWPDVDVDDPNLRDLIAAAHARVRDIHRRTAEFGDRSSTVPAGDDAGEERAVGGAGPEISDDPLLAT